MDENEETEVGEAESGGEGELDHYIIGTMGEGTRKDKVGRLRCPRKRWTKDNCLSSVELVEAHPHEARLEPHELVVSAEEITCVRRPVRQQQLDATIDDHFHDNASSNH
ncbi:hypothetical protein B296_00057680 [Ensete ventricosum]|uniref:Uncharacterized protein n=1 Tax=Ensete ventricosum TaxID=4639 RepID=A0A426X436_ENSVE|nr:hypothetical protein B296_00057680 [Ensete ventricosum]